MDIVRHVYGKIADESSLNVCRDRSIHKTACVCPSIEFNLILDLCFLGTSYRTMYATVFEFTSLSI